MITTHPLTPRALNHCMDGLLQQQMWYGVYNLNPPLSPSPSTHTHTHTLRHIHALPAPPSQCCSTASVCVLREPAAPWKHFPPSLPTSLSIISASFLTIHAFLGWVSESVRPKRETKKKTETTKRKEENRDVTDHQHAGHCRRDKEGELLERLEGPGYWCVYCGLSVLCGFERWTVISACRLNIHDTTGVYTWVRVCSACTHLSSNCILYRGIKRNIYLRLLSHGHALVTDPFYCMCVLPKKKRKEKNKGEGGERH